MKKVVRTVWISLLSGLAFLVACSCQNKLSRAEKKQLKQERAVILDQIEQVKQDAIVYSDAEKVMAAKQDELAFRSRLDEINNLLGDKQATLDNNNEMGKINREIDSLKQVIRANIPPCVYGPPVNDPGYLQFKKDQERRDLEQRIDSLNTILRKREGACVYGSPEIIKKYGQETERIRKEAADLIEQLKALENE
ncbi:MAG: hypothetical protein IKU00_10025 [Bacteroidales bacterium]|nr:hypothetical protein [Bacteroidales bacterium]